MGVYNFNGEQIGLIVDKVLETQKNTEYGLEKYRKPDGTKYTADEVFARGYGTNGCFDIEDAENRLKICKEIINEVYWGTKKEVK